MTEEASDFDQLTKFQIRKTKSRRKSIRYLSEQLGKLEEVKISKLAASCEAIVKQDRSVWIKIRRGSRISA